MIRRPRRSTLFPYTTLSGSVTAQAAAEHAPRKSRRESSLDMILSFYFLCSNPAIERVDHFPLGLERKLVRAVEKQCVEPPDRKSTRLNSSHGYISYAVFCLN